MSPLILPTTTHWQSQCHPIHAAAIMLRPRQPAAVLVVFCRRPNAAAKQHRYGGLQTHLKDEVFMLFSLANQSTVEFALMRLFGGRDV